MELKLSTIIGAKEEFRQVLRSGTITVTGTDTELVVLAVVIATEEEFLDVLGGGNVGVTGIGINGKFKIAMDEGTISCRVSQLPVDVEAGANTRGELVVVKLVVTSIAGN